MLYTIPNLNDPLIDLIKDDPVRPSIPTSSRIHDHAEILVLLEEGQPQAVVCVAYLEQVPRTECELGQTGDRVAAFYTIWSYAPRSGRKLIAAARQHIQQQRPQIGRFVTLSPKTEMARKFHLANGAQVLQDNADTVNYEYL